MNLSKTVTFKFIDVNEEDSVWVLNGETMCAM
jgi:hypothetical protein